MLTAHIARYADGHTIPCRCPIGAEHTVVPVPEYVVPVDPADATVCEACE
jgi:hypothetical protein